MGETNKKTWQDKRLATTDFLRDPNTASPTPTKGEGLTDSNIIGILARTLGKRFLRLLFYLLMSKGHNDRLSPRTTNSCTYSYGDSSGLSPDFLIPASAARDATVLTLGHDVTY